jgi:GH18 family chitinase
MAGGVARRLMNSHLIRVGDDDDSDSSQQQSTLERRVCYFANWAPYRDLNPPLYPDDIDPALCTHIHYAFAKIDLQSLALLPTEEHDMNWTERTNMPLYIRLYGLKRRNMALKILLAVGGWSAKSGGFNLATRNHQNRSKFINQTIKLLREWNFDGVDLGRIFNIYTPKYILMMDDIINSKRQISDGYANFVEFDIGF